MFKRKVLSLDFNVVSNLQLICLVVQSIKMEHMKMLCPYVLKLHLGVSFFHAHLTHTLILLSICQQK